MSEHAKEYSGEINNVNDLLRIAKRIYKNKKFCEVQCKRNKHLSLQNTFGIWFRGQSEASYSLEPSIFRKKAGNNIYDENSIFVHAKLRLANYRKKCLDDFDWLCLMQHYDIPTRVLDWSESAIIALYFTVRNLKVDKDGELIVLNSRSLNQYVGDNFGSPSFSVVDKIGWCPC